MTSKWIYKYSIYNFKNFWSTYLFLKPAFPKLSKYGLADIKAADYDAVFYPGGHGPLWDLAEDKDSIMLIEEFYNTQKPVALVCHAPAALKHVKALNGDPLVKGKKVTGFTNEEEEGVKLTSVVPFLVEDMLKENGAHYEKKAAFEVFVIEDGLLITGQNPASSKPAAEKLLALLKQG